MGRLVLILALWAGAPDASAEPPPAPPASKPASKPANRYLAVMAAIGAGVLMGVAHRQRSKGPKKKKMRRKKGR